MRHFWITKQNKKIFIKDMKDAELVDAIEFLVKTATDIKRTAIEEPTSITNFKFTKHINSDVLKDLVNIGDAEFADLLFPEKLGELRKEMYERKIPENWKP